MSIYLGNTPLANTGYDKANTDLSNLTSTGKNIANWSNNVTNCITEIPQDIKLELNNGTLTLKAGSKVYVPNGFESDGTTPKFNALITDTDLNAGCGGTGLMALGGFYNTTENKITSIWANTLMSSCLSGANITGSGNFYGYDTSINTVNYYRSGVKSERYSFMLAVIDVQAGVPTSIVQVFNGFGYIGSTVFALPGVKGLIPNGRNNDGTLNNIEFETSNVLTQTYSDTPTGYYYIQVKSDYVGRAARSGWGYNEKENYVRWISSTSPMSQIICGSMYMTSGKFTNIEIPTAFHALDYNDSSTISGWAMPSSRYIDLTLGASGSSYTAPANGYIKIGKTATAASQYLSIAQAGYKRSMLSTNANAQLWDTMPIAKGTTFYVNYTASGNTNAFKFIYAEGESNV